MEVLNIQENIFLLSKIAYLVQKEPYANSYILPLCEKNGVNELLAKVITTRNNIKTHWINWVKFDDKNIEVGINKFVKEILMEKFKPNTGIVKIARLKNHYSPQFYELFQNLPLEITPEELKKRVGIIDKYERYYDLKKKVILPSLEDLERIDVSVELLEIKNGKKVEKLLFTKGVKMNVSEMKIGQIGVIKKITATEPLKSRLYSLGVVKKETIKVLKHTIAKNTFEVEINKSRIALREDEAKMILVEVKQ